MWSRTQEKVVEFCRALIWADLLPDLNDQAGHIDPKFVAESDREGLAGFFHALTQARGLTLPDPVGPTWETAFRENRERNAKMAEAVNALAALAVAEGVPIIVFGGIRLAGSVYSDPGARPPEPQPILVQTVHAEALRKILQQRGFFPQDSGDWTRDHLVIQCVDHPGNLVSPVAVPPGLNLADIDEEWVWKQRMPLPDLNAWTPLPEKEFTLLCMAACCRRGFVRLHYALDLALFLERYSEFIDWRWIREEGKKRGFLHFILFSLRYLRDIFCYEAVLEPMKVLGEIPGSQDEEDLFHEFLTHDAQSENVLLFAMAASRNEPYRDFLKRQLLLPPASALSLENKPITVADYAGYWANRVRRKLKGKKKE